jgi:uridine phosphorylase
MQFSELILQDNRLYHLHLEPGEVSTTIISVGDPGRVDSVSKHFDSIELKRIHREFVTHTGVLDGKRITVVSTGIGTDNVDIVLNELDALFNVDFSTRQAKSSHQTLEIYRIGTSGALVSDVAVDSFLYSEAALGLDALMNYYPEHRGWVEHDLLPKGAYFSKADNDLVDCFALEGDFTPGFTLTTAGFYAPQGRRIRLQTNLDLDKLGYTQIENRRLTNIEMETAGIYALSALLGHKAISLNAILANRAAGTFSSKPDQTVSALIERSLEIIINRR